jgi:hypothetical protein
MPEGSQLRHRVSGHPCWPQHVFLSHKPPKGPPPLPRRTRVKRVVVPIYSQPGQLTLAASRLAVLMGTQATLSIPRPRHWREVRRQRSGAAIDRSQDLTSGQFVNGRRDSLRKIQIPSSECPQLSFAGQCPSRVHTDREPPALASP